MEWGLVASFLVAALVVQLLPGPGMLFILAQGMAGGPRAGVAAAFGAVTPRSTRRVFVRALLNHLANPKVILFYVAFLPQFVQRELGAISLQLLALGGAFLLIGLVIDLAIGALSGQLGAMVRRRRGVRRAVDRVAGLVLAGLGIRLLVSDR